MRNELLQRQEIERQYHNQRSKLAATDNLHREESRAYKFFWDKVGNVRGQRVLDFGCVNGWVSIRLAKCGAEVYGVDISDEFINISRE